MRTYWICPKCGTTLSDQPSDKTFGTIGATSAPPAIFTTVPTWTTTPPRVTERPQFFWFRLGPGAKQIPVEVFELGGYPYCNTFGQIKKLSSRDGGEWWPVRISPPGEEGR
jgi:hypothetical protein